MRGVEAVHIGCGASGQLLNLAPAQPYPGSSLDGGRRVRERPAGRLDRGESAQPVGVFLDRQVQRGVRRVQVGLSPRPVGDARHRDRAEPGGQPPLVPVLGHAPPVPVGVDHLDQALLSYRPQIQTVLQQLAQ